MPLFGHLNFNLEIHKIIFAIKNVNECGNTAGDKSTALEITYLT